MQFEPVSSQVVELSPLAARIAALLLVEEPEIPGAAAPLSEHGAGVGRYFGESLDGRRTTATRKPLGSRSGVPHDLHTNAAVTMLPIAAPHLFKQGAFMSKKQDFLRCEQSRDKHPEREQMGSPAAAVPGLSVGSADAQPPGTGKVANDHNKTGNQKPTQVHEGRRTPESRHDRQTMGAGPQNQISARKGGGGAGRARRGAG